ncbi:MAG TPA: cupredoxin domain-containing protein [Sphingobacteriaceae bacterium]|nr:cupredoxin domain-containing protein [Sphingobacteriaceae bacterium]
MIKLRGLQRVGLAAVMLLALVVLAACGGGGGGGGTSDNGGGTVADGEIEVVLQEYSFTPNNIEVPVGKPITFVLKNEGSLEHDMAFDDLDQVSDLVSAGDTATFEVTFEEAGTYPFYCTVPGHREAGMEGTVTAR